jgi:hypothetical protein
MKPSIAAPARVALIAAAVAICATDTPGTSPTPHAPALAMHSPIHARRTDDGHLLRGPRNEVATENWSGYAVASFETSSSKSTVYYTSASATWTVPKVSYLPFGKNSSSWEYSSTWVGIGGYCENANCTQGDSTLIQLGTEQDVSFSGATDYYAWYEMLPQYPYLIPHPVTPGDAITAALTCIQSCTSGSLQTWRLTMSDSPAAGAKYAAWSWSSTFTYASPLLSAEWIDEAPWYNGVLPLADFGTVTFDPVATNGLNPNLTLATNAIVMEAPWGQTSNPAAPLTGDAFSACWGSGTSLTPCTTTLPQPMISTSGFNLSRLRW